MGSATASPGRGAPGSGQGEPGQLGRVDDAQHGDLRAGGVGVGEEDAGRAVGRAAAGPADEQRSPAGGRDPVEEGADGVVTVGRDVRRPGAAVLEADPARRDRSGAGEGLVESAGEGRAPRRRTGSRFHPGSLAQAHLTSGGG